MQLDDYRYILLGYPNLIKRELEVSRLNNTYDYNLNNSTFINMVCNTLKIKLIFEDNGPLGCLWGGKIITLRSPNKFIKDYHNIVFFHELTHWYLRASSGIIHNNALKRVKHCTKHNKRKCSICTHIRINRRYALEEVLAETTAMLIAQDYQLDITYNSSYKYIRRYALDYRALANKDLDPRIVLSKCMKLKKELRGLIDQIWYKCKSL